MPKKPRPFVKARIEIGAPSERSWQDITAERLSPGDIVPDRGEVVKVTVSANVAVEYFSGTVEFYHPQSSVRAFALKEQHGVGG